MEQYKIVRYNEMTNQHILEGKEGRQFPCDIFVDASINVEMDESNYKEVSEGLVGKSVSIESLQPYSYIGTNVSLIY